jgi:fatty acid desaturase
MNIGDPLAMPKKCTVCNQNFEPEPGFYYGAMFISYIFTSFVILAFAALCILVFGWGVYGTFAFIIFFCIVTFLWVARVSRSIWIHLVVYYEEDFDGEEG